MDDQNSFNLILQGGKLRDQGVTELYRKYAKQFRNKFLHQRLNVADADDIVQETFINIVRHCDKYNGSPLRAWLWLIAINCMKDHFRSVKSRSTTDSDKEAQKIKKDAIALERSAAMEAGASRIQDGVKVTELPYADETEEKADHISSLPMFTSIDNVGEEDESGGLAALEGQFTSLWNYDPDPKNGLFTNCIDQGYAEFAKKFSERWYALSLAYDGYDTAYIAEALQRTPGATREFLSQTRKRIEEFLLPCKEYR